MNYQKDLEPAGGQMTLFSLAGSRDLASPTALQESEKGKTTTVISGRKCLELFEKSNRHGSWAKTFAALLVGTGEWYSTKCKLTWKILATKSSRLYFQLAPSTLPIEETGFGLLPTVRTSDMNHPGVHGTGGQDLRTTIAIKMGLLPTPRATKISGTDREDFSPSLPGLMNKGLLPTPTAFDYNSARTPQKWEQDKAKYAEQGVNLQNPLKQMAVLGLLPTPTAMEGSKITGNENQNSLTKMARQTTGKTSQLNPRFVAEMMGFPPNWTELPFQSGAIAQSKPTGTP